MKFIMSDYGYVTSPFKTAMKVVAWGGIFKLLRSLGFDSKESILLDYVATGGPGRQPYSYSAPSHHRLFENLSTGLPIYYIQVCI
jgi:hypothetical protein